MGNDDFDNSNEEFGSYEPGPDDDEFEGYDGDAESDGNDTPSDEGFEFNDDDENSENADDNGSYDYNAPQDGEEKAPEKEPGMYYANVRRSRFHLVV